MTYLVKNKPIRLGEEVFKAGDTMTKDDFKEVPSRIRARRIKSLVNLGRLIEVPGELKKQCIALTGAGDRCKMDALDDSHYCGRKAHKIQEEKILGKKVENGSKRTQKRSS